MSHLSIEPQGVGGQWDFTLGSNGNPVRGGLRAQLRGTYLYLLAILSVQSRNARLRRAATTKMGAEKLEIYGMPSVSSPDRGAYALNRQTSLKLPVPASELRKKRPVQLLHAPHRSAFVEIFAHEAKRILAQLLAQRFRTD